MDFPEANELFMKFFDYLRPFGDDAEEFLMKSDDPLVDDAPDEAWNALNKYMEYLIPYMREQEEQKKQGIVTIS